MDTPELEQQYMTAGSEYEHKLRELGLEANFVSWAFDVDTGQHVLLLITDFFDLKGPLEVAEQLFKAYNSSLTPKEIDPFRVRLHSINHSVAKVILATHANPTIPLPDFSQTANYEMREQWVIKNARAQQRKSTDLIRRWNRFTNNVQAAA